jgi:DNA polymerase-3 subunit epsilon
VKEAIEAMKEDSLSCAIIMEGRSDNENSVVILENGKYEGFGFTSKTDRKISFLELKENISPQRDNREIQLIIRSYLQNHNDYNLVFAE